MIRLDLEVNNRGDAALKQAATGLDGVGKSAHNADRELKELTKSQQNAALKMMRMHEEALKLNQGFGATNDKAQRVSQALSAMSSTATASAAALGLPIGQLNALNAVADVSALQLTKTAAGFNAASIGVVGAGLAIGMAIGTLLRQIPAVVNWMDRWADSIFGVASAAEEAAKTANFAKIDGGASKAAKATVDHLISQGKSLKDIRELYKAMPPEMDKYVDAIEKRAEADKKAAKATKDAAAEALQAYETWLSSPAPWEYGPPVPGSYGGPAEDNVMNLGGQGNFTRLMGFAPGGGAVIEIQTQFERVGEEAGKSFGAGLGDALQDLPGVIQRAIQGGGNVGRSIGALFGANIFGSDSGLVKGLSGALSKGLGKLLGGTLGSMIPGLGTLLGSGIGSLFGKLFGGNAEHKKVNDLRDAFLEAHGGYQKLAQELAKSGDQGLVQKIFDTKTVKDFEAAVGEAQAALAQQQEEARHALEMQNLALDRVHEAMERYEIDASEMGLAFKQAELDKQALQLWGDWELLNVAMGDSAALAEKMAPSMQEYIDAALAAGATIPENLRPIIQQMIDLGLLTDENGEAFKTLEDAGLDFGQSIEDSMKDAAAAIKELVNTLRTLYGLPPINIPVNVPSAPGAGNPAGVDPAGVGGNHPVDDQGNPILAGGGFISKSGYAYLHAGETVVPYGDVTGGPAAPPVPFDPPGGGGGGGGGGVTGGPSGPVARLERAAAQMARARPITVNQPPINISGVGNTTEILRAVNAGLRDNKEGTRTLIVQIARSAGGRF